MKKVSGIYSVFFVTAAILATVSVSVTGVATAADTDYPTKPIRVVVPQAAAGSQDTISRLVGQKLGDALGQQIVVENRPGANGIIGTEMASKAAPDGYTLLATGTGSHAINPSLYSKIPYDPVKQFAPVALIGYSTSVLVVHPSTPVKTIADLIAVAKAKPGEIRYASAGNGSSPHLSAEMFRSMTGVNIIHIPYKGSTPGVIATISGEVSMMFTGVASAIAHIKAGRLRALSVNGPKRSPTLSEVPTANESGLPGFEVDFWVGIFAPSGTPRAVITKLNAEINRIVGAREIREQFLKIGVDPVGGTPEQFGAILQKDIERWGKTIKISGMKME
jgi:tripartite-type tricarboxylate transporter receptor subunit TctC